MNKNLIPLLASLLSAVSRADEHSHHHAIHNVQHMDHRGIQTETLKAPPAADHAHHHPPNLQALPDSTHNASNLAPTPDLRHFSKPHMGDEDVLASMDVDRLEMVNVRDEFSVTYDWQAWVGQDYDRLVLRAEGEIGQGQFKHARNEMLWGHALTAFWDTQLGLRIDSGLGNDRLWAAFGVQGFAPYWLYVEATAYVGEEGRTAFRLETEYDLRITQKLILQPRVELNFYSQRDDSRLVSSGLSNYEAGLRLRYDVTRKIAPYIGVEWSEILGSAGNIIESQGNRSNETRFVAGVHFRF